MIINKKTLIQLNDLLGFDYKGHEQDWSIEFADQHRLSEFIDIAITHQLSIEEKYAVVSLILSSYDDYLSDNQNGQDPWPDIIKLLNHDPLYDDVLNYWALWDEERKDHLFHITPLIRSYLKGNH